MEDETESDMDDSEGEQENIRKNTRETNLRFQTALTFKRFFFCFFIFFTIHATSSSFTPFNIVRAADKQLGVCTVP